MARLDIKDRVLRRFTRRPKKLVSTSAVGLLLTGVAEGQEGDPGIAIDSLESLDSWRLLETGDLELVFENGSVQIVRAVDFTLVDGTYYISQSLADEILAAVEGDRSDIVPFMLGFSSGLVGLVVLLEGDDDNPPAPDVPGPDPDVAPVITSDPAASVPEDQTAALTVVASDADGDVISYAISGGADSDLFSIDSSTGEVTFNDAPDFENPVDNGTDNIYNIVVSATANGETVTQEVAITVTNADEAPVFTSLPTVSVAENQTSALIVQATDADGDPVTYEIIGGADIALFSIDSATGEVTFNDAPDSENPGDDGTDNIYNIQVSATANGKTVTQDIAITVAASDADGDTIS
ncbi:MAG: cadherin domain-containing protein [Pseudomonadota bacterium]